MIDEHKYPNETQGDMSLVSRLLHQMIDEKYRTLLDESSDLMCITDRSGKFIYVNKKLADSLGYTKKELLGMHMKDIIAEESRGAFLEKTKEFFKEGRVRVENFVIKTRYGGRIVGEMNSAAFYDNAGKYCGAKAVFKDRTRLLEMERLEKKYESMLEDGINALDYIIIILDKSFGIKWASTSVQKYFELDKTAIIGEDMRELIKTRIKPLIQGEGLFLENLFAAYESHGSVESFECEVFSLAGGENYFMEHWSHPIGQGDLEGGRIEIFRDITARKKSEEMLEYYYKKIHAIMEHAVEGIVELKTDNSIEFVNKSFQVMLGYSEMEMLNRSLTDFILPEERMRLASVKLIRRARDVTFVKKDGGLMYALVSSIPLVFGTQAPHALFFISDITETKTATMKLKDANLTLRALNDSLLDLSLRDVRTGFYNHRYLAERLNEEIKRARRHFRPLAVLMIDIDFFKTVNDTYGHSYGDVILQEFAALLKKSVRETDVLVRSGGEEFVVFLSETDTFGALTVAQKIIRAVKNTFLGEEPRKVQLSVSIGVASYPEVNAADAISLLDAADQAMYQSKAKGRNNISVFSAGGLSEEARQKEEVDEPLFQKLSERLKAINARNEEAVLEAMKPMVREAAHRQGYEYGYVDRVVERVEALARSFSLGPQEVREARRAAFLSNLGFLSLSPELLSRKREDIKKEEFANFRQHPSLSLEMIKDISFLEPLSRSILCHHERFGGDGYPQGLKGDEIPLVSRMIAVAEVYEALVAPRPYRSRGFSSQEALRLIQEESGRQFDPAVVDHFAALFPPS